MGQRDSLFPLQRAETRGKGTQGKSGSPYPYHEQVMLYMCHVLQGRSAERVAARPSDFEKVQPELQDLHALVQPPLESADTQVCADRCFSLQGFLRLQWIWNNGIQVNNNSFFTWGKTKASHDARLTQHHHFLSVLASRTFGKTDGFLWWKVWLVFRGVLLIQEQRWTPDFHHQHCTWTVFGVPEES